MNNMRIINFLFVFFLYSVNYSNTIKIPEDYMEIQTGINNSQNGDTVLVAPGIYYENLNFKGKNIVLASHFILDNDRSFIESTIIDGSRPINEDTASCVLIISGEDSSAVLEGFTLTGGKGTKWLDEHGAGVYVEGGGILITLSSPTIKNNIIHNNEAIRKPAGTISAGGGGIRCGDGSPLICNNIIMKNKGMYGAGVVMNYASGIIKNNLIIDNEVYQAVSGAPTFGGGGIWAFQVGPVIIENNTIAGNSSAGRGAQGGKGGGIFAWAVNAVVRNNIIFHNSQESGQDLNVSGGTVSVVYNCISGGYNGEGNIGDDPAFDAVGYHLQPVSPCVDAGDPDSEFNDPEDIQNPGTAEFPSLGTTRNDMGVYGGNSRSFLPEEITGIEDEGKEMILSDFKLFQNFPNPFNPETKIKYEIPVEGNVSLKVFDCLGNEISEPLAEHKNAGIYEFTLNGRDYSSGVYFCGLSFGGSTKYIKVVLVK